MALFRRNKTDTTGTMPEEVTSYYEAENRERTWMAWLLALVTLAVTAIIIIGLFFGGRWVYRKVRHNPGNTAPAVTEQTKESESSESSSEKHEETAPSTSSTSTSSPTTGNVDAPTNPSPTATTPTPTNTSATAGTPAANTSLPNTGPGDMLAVFVVVSIGAYLLHRRFAAV